MCGIRSISSERNRSVFRSRPEFRLPPFRSTETAAVTLLPPAIELTKAVVQAIWYLRLFACTARGILFSFAQSTYNQVESRREAKLRWRSIKLGLYLVKRRNRTTTAKKNTDRKESFDKTKVFQAFIAKGAVRQVLFSTI